MLTDRLNQSGRTAKYLKYPVYDLTPTGPALNEYLRQGNPRKLSPKDAQILYAKNREDYEPILKKDLESGKDVVAEDYWGTGVAWGVGAGVDKDFLLDLNKRFQFEDLAILLSGTRFETAVEKKHLHEENIEFTNRVELVHQDLAKQFGWKIVNANQDKEQVAEDIWKLVESVI